MAACPHAAIAGQRGSRAQWFRRAGLAGCGRPALQTKSMMHRRGAGTGCEIPGAGGRCSRFRADIKSAPTVWTEVHAVGGVPGPGGWRADVGIGPYEAEPSNPGGNRNLVPGGHKARPYGKTGGGSVGADFISAHTHRRVGCTHPVGADVGIGPYEAEPSNLAKIGSRSGRPYRPPLRGNRRRVRRGGLYGRPCAPTCWMHHRRTHPARYRQQKHHRRTYPLWGASGDGAIYTGTAVDAPLS